MHLSLKPTNFTKNRSIKWKLFEPLNQGKHNRQQSQSKFQMVYYKKLGGARFFGCERVTEHGSASNVLDREWTPERHKYIQQPS